jgi:hypothetical protein
LGVESLDDAQRDLLSDLIGYVRTALVQAHGRPVGDDRFLLQVDQPNARSASRLLVEVTPSAAEAYFNPLEVLRADLHADAMAGREELLELLGHRADAITLAIAGKRLTVDPTLYDFLRQVCDGQQPSLRDRSRFQALSVIGSTLGNALAGGSDVKAMFVESPNGGMHRVQRVAFGDRFSVTEVQA